MYNIVALAPYDEDCDEKFIEQLVSESFFLIIEVKV